jgi:hypothetical protein
LNETVIKIESTNLTKKKSIRQRNLITKEKLERWTDEEVLTNLNTILTRATLSTDYITEELDEDSPPIIVAEVLSLMCGDKAVFSEPRQLDWPLQMMPVPDSLKHTVN